MTDLLPPDADAGSESRPDAAPPGEVQTEFRPDAAPPGEVQTEFRPDAASAAATGSAALRDDARPPRRLPLVALGYLAAAVVGALLLGGSLVAVGGVGRAVPSPSPSPTPPPNVANGPSLGTSAAPVTIEIWADYQCPFCRL